MKVAVAQMNSYLGFFRYNRDKILRFINESSRKKCDIVVFPEAALFGYPPSDLLEKEEFVNQQLKELAQIEKRIPSGIVAIIGLFTKNPSSRGRPYFNSAALIQKGKQTKFFHKQLFPPGDVFDEDRFMESGRVQDNFLKIKNKRILLTLCEDIWGWPYDIRRRNKQIRYNLHKENPLKLLKTKPDFVINMSASPYYPGKANQRKQVARATAKHFQAPLFYVNIVGAQDEIIFDGSSFVINSSGKILLQSAGFKEELNVFDLSKMEGQPPAPSLLEEEELRRALVLGIRDYCHKINIQKIHLGLSGGIDSALVAALAVDAVGPSNVTCVALPGPFNSPLSLSLAESMAMNLKVRFLQMPITSAFEKISEEINQILGLKEFSVVHENLQARLRGMYLMSIANAENSLLLATANKSELASGYSTLYGDMCGGLAPIGDLKKNQVYKLALHYNQNCQFIQNEIISRAPSAELRPNQKDQDTLPDYALLDKSVIKLIEKNEPASSATDRWLQQVLLQTEFKRWQAAPILKVSPRSFGRGRRFPIACYHRPSEPRKGINLKK